MTVAVWFRRPTTTIGVIGGALTLHLVATALAGPIALPGCPESCGGVQVPYPFGIGRGCFHQGFNLTCDEAQHPAKLLLGEGDDMDQVLGISLPDCTVRIRRKISWVQYAAEFNGSWSVPTPDDGPLMVSSARNSFVAFGCNVLAKLIPYNAMVTYTSVCAAVCVNTPDASSCSGVGCCRTSIASLGADLPSYGVQVKHLEGETGDYHRAAFIVDQDWFSRAEAEMARNFSNLYFPIGAVYDQVAMMDSVPVVLEWSLDLIRDADLFVLAPTGPQSSEFRCISSNSFSYTIDANYDRRRCNCCHGYEGNPYIGDGCQDIDECQLPDIYPCHGTCINMPGTYRCSSKKSISSHPGLIAIIAISAGFFLLFSILDVASIINKLKQRRAKLLRQKLFKRNHGLLLQQLISSNKDIAERMKIFSSEELEQATNKFDQNRIIGGGGHGTVYKGILSDQRVVAIKKSKIVVQREIDQFINEVVILSQTNHRNVVKLFGCCLETEVPLLVYEFISNRTLSYHLHEQCENPLSWNDRLRIALETARAIAYLHSAASIFVFHRDIKCANILLTDTFTAKYLILELRGQFQQMRQEYLQQSKELMVTLILNTTTLVDSLIRVMFTALVSFFRKHVPKHKHYYSFGVILAELLTRIKPIFSSHSSEGTSLASHFVTMIRDYRLSDILDPQIVEDGGSKDAKVIARLAEACLNLKGEERPTMRQVETALEDVLGSNIHSGCQVTRTSQSALKDWPQNQSKGNNEGTRLYSLKKEFIQSSEIPR